VFAITIINLKISYYLPKSPKMSIKNKKIIITEELHSALAQLKYKLHKKTFESLLIFLLNHYRRSLKPATILTGKPEAVQE